MRAVAILIVALLCHGGTKTARGILFPPQLMGRGIENELQKLKPGLTLAIIKDEDTKQGDRPRASWLWDLLNRRWDVELVKRKMDY